MDGVTFADVTLTLVCLLDCGVLNKTSVTDNKLLTLTETTKIPISNIDKI